MFFLFNDQATPEVYTYGHTLSLHDALPFFTPVGAFVVLLAAACMIAAGTGGQGSVMHDMFIRDGIADVLKISLLVVSAVALGFAWTFMRERGLYKGELPVLVLFATVGMMLLVSAGNLTMVYVRAEERRVGKECVSKCRYRWSPIHYKKKTEIQRQNNH